MPVCASSSREKFEEIRKEFDRVFRQLFGGGKGTLELEEDTDVLEAGIRIISQPPGKKLQNMMQLSGGEKALTAIALHFCNPELKAVPRSVYLTRSRRRSTIPT